MTKAIGVSPENNRAREVFFKKIYGSLEGWMCLALKDAAHKVYDPKFYQWPQDLDAILNEINAAYYKYDVYCGVHLSSQKSYQRWAAIQCSTLWADLDTCSPTLVTPAPSLVVESSPSRYHGYWFLSEPIMPGDAEDISRKIAYTYAEAGADKSGWDLAQVLRVPMTYNYKYAATGDTPVVEVLKEHSPLTIYSPSDFDSLPQVPGYEYMSEPVPEIKLSSDEVLDKYKGRLDPMAIHLFDSNPNGEWSGVLWRLECTLFECGLSREEVFAVAIDAACNKYARDARDMTALWREVCKAERLWEDRQTPADEPIKLSPVLDREETRSVGDNYFVDRYVKWGMSRSDAPQQFFEAGALTILSTVLAGKVKLPTSVATIVPNLWFMLLGPTTIDRKSTVMDMTMDFIDDFDQSALLATDGSAEGMLSAIQHRPNQPSVFHRDEISGFLEAMRKRDHLAGMAETLTRLYDGKKVKRQLRREVFDIRDPILILLSGGVRTRVLEWLDISMIHSGFVPRFVFIQSTGEQKTTRPLGPPTQIQEGERESLLTEVRDMRNHYDVDLSLTVEDRKVKTKKVWTAELTPEAWERYNKLGVQLDAEAMATASQDLYAPVFARLTIVVLKVAVLLAASRQRPDPRASVLVELSDVMKAISYVPRWREWAIDVIENAGLSHDERLIAAVLKDIRFAQDEGVARSVLMRKHHLSAFDATRVFDTIEQRNQARAVREGKGRKYFDTLSTRPELARES